MQSRIKRLEGLVLSLMNGNAKDEKTSSQSDSSGLDSENAHRQAGIQNYLDTLHDPDEDDSSDYADDHMGDVADDSPIGVAHLPVIEAADIEEVRNGIGIMQVDKGSSSFRGGTHFESILNEVCDAFPLRNFKLTYHAYRYLKSKRITNRTRRRW